MFAVIKTGGKQYRVAAEDVITIATLEAEPGAAVTFDQVLMVTNDNGTQVGAPLVTGVTVTGEVVEHTRGAKVIAWTTPWCGSPRSSRVENSPRRPLRRKPPRLRRTTLRRPNPPPRKRRLQASDTEHGSNPWLTKKQAARLVTAAIPLAVVSASRNSAIRK
jgi:ribosomal protein L21